MSSTNLSGVFGGPVTQALFELEPVAAPGNGEYVEKAIATPEAELSAQLRRHLCNAAEQVDISYFARGQAESSSGSAFFLITSLNSTNAGED